MPKTWNRVTPQKLKLIAEKLLQAAGRMSDIIGLLQANAMDSVLLAWSDRTDEQIQAIIALAAVSVLDAEEQALAKQMGTTSRQERAKLEAKRTSSKNRPNRQKSVIKKPTKPG